MAKGYLAFVLHAHLPFVRHPEYESFLEERWFYEAITETYIPLLKFFNRLVEEKVPFEVTVSISPSLLAMMEDPLLVPEETREEIVGLALEHRLMTRYTAFVAVDDGPPVNPGGDALPVHQPVAGTTDDGTTTTSNPPRSVAPRASSSITDTQPVPPAQPSTAPSNEASPLGAGDTPATKPTSLVHDGCPADGPATDTSVAATRPTTATIRHTCPPRMPTPPASPEALSDRR